MTSPQRSLHPASGNDRGALLGALEFVARCDLQLAEVVGTVIGHGMALEPGPQVFDRVHVGCVGRQECDLNVAAQAVQEFAHQAASVSLEPVPDHQEGLLQIGLERFEEIDDLLLLDAALVKSEQAVGASQSSDDRHMVPVEMKLDDGRLSFGCPGPHSGGALADSGLVDTDDQPAFSLGFF